MKASASVQLLQHAVKTYTIGSSIWAGLSACVFLVQYIGLALALNEVGCDLPGSTSTALCAIERFFQAMALPGVRDFEDFDNVVYILTMVLLWSLTLSAVLLVMYVNMRK